MTIAIPDSFLDALKEALNPATFQLIMHIASVAEVRGCPAYLVGGPMRDLLLGDPLNDIDLVFEGEAIPLGKELARALGGHAITHERFGTVKWVLDDPAFPPKHALTRAPDLPSFIDLVTARDEQYEHPAALPTVTFAGMKEDLFRRDFTLNTLALRLNGAEAGQLLDYYGGMADLRAGRLRVLHDRSFIDDPTRIFRALRFETRLEARMERRTRALLEDSVPLIELLSPDRVRHELILILEEEIAAAMITKMARWKMLSHVLPNVQWGRAQAQRLARLKAEGEGDIPTLFAALLWGAAPETVEAVATRLCFPNSWLENLRALAQLQQDSPLQQAALSNSALYFRLREEKREVLLWLARLSEKRTTRARVRRFLEDLIQRELTVSGNDLKSLGVPPGPAYREILDEVRAALMDSRAPQQVDQHALLRRLARASVNKEQYYGQHRA